MPLIYIDLYTSIVSPEFFNMVGCRSFDNTFCSNYCCIFRILSFNLSIDRFTMIDCIKGIRLEQRNVTDIHQFIYINCLTITCSIWLDAEATILTSAATAVVYFELYPSTCLLIVSRSAIVLKELDQNYVMSLIYINLYTSIVSP